ncbi:MAG: trypsin-like peptidase domain-containing protein [Oscillospiraceae bacterium]|nr:trypsin-like peptidase domain-containing protein [Oscillospiraceae bacterium]
MKRKVLTPLLICCALLFGLIAGFGAAGLVPTDGRLPSPVFSSSPARGETVAFRLAGPGSSDLDPVDIYDLACRQTVGVSSEINSVNAFGQLASSTVMGTGFIVTDDGYILTNFHVVQEAYYAGQTATVTLYDGGNYDAEIVGCEEDNDIAVLKIKKNGLSSVCIGDSSGMKVGESIYAVGHPLGSLTYTMTAGIISALDRSISVEAGKSVHMFQVDAAINSGNSGGPIYNSRGEVIGMATAKYSRTGIEGLGFAIPISEAAEYATQIIKYGYVPGKPDMGLTVSDMSARAAAYYGVTGGVYVSSADDAGCAAKAGIKTGDIIVTIDGADVSDEISYAAALKSHAAGDTVTVGVSRGGEKLSFTVTLDEYRPLSASERAKQADRQQELQDRSIWDYDYGDGGFFSWFESLFPFRMR